MLIRMEERSAEATLNAHDASAPKGSKFGPISTKMEALTREKKARKGGGGLAHINGRPCACSTKKKGRKTEKGEGVQKSERQDTGAEVKIPLKERQKQQELVRVPIDGDLTK